MVGQTEITEITIIKYDKMFTSDEKFEFLNFSNW